MPDEYVNEEVGEELPVEDAATEGESSTPEPEAGEPPASEPERKNKVQERIDQLVREREDAKRERDRLLEAVLRQQSQEQPKPQLTDYPDLPEPKSDQFETYDQYVDARADYRAEIKMRRYLEQQQQVNRTQSNQSWNEQALTKYADWNEVFTPDLAISDTMGETIKHSSSSHDLAYYLGKNPSEARRIFNMPAHLQSYELGKLEGRIATPPQKTKTNAPNPTQPVGGMEVPKKNPEDMSYDEYKAWRKEGGGH